MDRKQPTFQQEIFRNLISKYMGQSSPVDTGHCIDFLTRNTVSVMNNSRVGATAGLVNLFKGLTEGAGALDISIDTAIRVERVFFFYTV